MNDVLEQRLAAKKRDLENQQEYFRIDMKNIEQSNYEDNAIIHEETENGNCRVRVSDAVEKDKWTLNLLQKE